MTAGWLMGNGAATSSTPASPSDSRARMARRVGIGQRTEGSVELLLGELWLEFGRWHNQMVI